MIPKIIHCVWVGPTPKPPIVLACEASWRRFCPDWEIRFWGNREAQALTNRYAREALARGKWAFVSDYLRLKALYEEGGFYLDTDLELLRPIDSFRAEDFVTGFIDRPPNVFLNMCFLGAIAHNVYVSEMLAEYERLAFVLPNGELDQTPNVVRMAHYFEQKLGVCFTDAHHAYRLDDKSIVHPVNYFNSREGWAVHHYCASWLDDWKRKLFLSLGPYKLLHFKRRLEAASSELALPSSERILWQWAYNARKRFVLVKRLG